MTEDEIYRVLDAFRTAIEQSAKRMNELRESFEKEKESLSKRLETLELTLYEEILKPANDYIEETNKNARFDDFNEKYGERFSEFAEPLKALEGDDYDIVREAFNKYDDFEGEKADVDTYVETLVEELGSQLSQIKEALGIPADTEIAVEETPEGEVEVVTEDGEVVASSDDEPGEEDSGEGEGEGEAEPEPEVEIVGSEEEDDDPEEVAAFEKELEDYKD